MEGHRRRHHRHKRGQSGKKIVYITPYLRLAVEIQKMYAGKGEKTALESEKNEDGRTVYLVCIFP